MSGALSYAHLSHLSTEIGLYEHALFTEPRTEHGYCVDDVARGLVVAVRAHDPAVSELVDVYLHFVLAAVRDDGTAHNRRSADGSWQDVASTDDHWGRALWALGTTAAETTDPAVCVRALEGARMAMRARSPWPRARAYAVLGATEVLSVVPDDAAARALVGRSRPVLLHHTADPAWPWPEPRLTYANSVLPEAVIAVGAVHGDDLIVREGTAMLRWLLDVQTRDGHVSVVPAGGFACGDSGPGFDQQPIEVAALAEACARAFRVTGAQEWRTAVERCRAWFLGDNDAGLAVYDASTGGGFDGLHRSSVNENQGAESTLAALSTLQLAARLDLAP
jgi:hypothetical protein